MIRHRLSLPGIGSGPLWCLILLPLLLLILSGCGQNTPDPTATPIPPPTVAPTLAPPTAAPTLAPTVVPTEPPPSPTLAPPPTPVPTDTPTPAPPPTDTPTPLTGPHMGKAPLVPVLAYHLINIPEGGEYNVSSEDFTKQMKWLHDNQYHAISPAQLVDAINNGTALPTHPVLITFDDNQVSPYTYALPVLKRYGFTAAFFIQTVTIGKDGFMDADQIKDLADSGFIIGGHTWDHRTLTQQPDEELQRQLDLSGNDLTTILGHPPEYLSYPLGLYDQHVVDVAKAHGYKGAFRLRDRDDPPVDPAFMIRRQIIAGVWSLDDFIMNIHNMEPDSP
jgi:peptidoglycan/xylan/chitin deacetylase (PgdA/CDA1 family)